MFKCLSTTFLNFFWLRNSKNGEGGIWTLAPLLTTYSLSRGAPSANLGTSPKCPLFNIHDIPSIVQYFFLKYKKWDISVLFQKKHWKHFAVIYEQIYINGSLSASVLKAERVGFEPTRPFGQTVFKTASLWPLRYLSIYTPQINTLLYFPCATLSILTQI